jgi:hypothetical protein
MDRRFNTCPSCLFGRPHDHHRIGGLLDGAYNIQLAIDLGSGLECLSSAEDDHDRL